jgi:4-cresol dehydrogenase (hydroxylating)
MQVEGAIQLEAALASFRAIVGGAHTIAGGPDLDRYAWCTGPLARPIPAVVRPADVEQVRRIVAAAAEHRVALYPISTGNNWGYGTALPMRAGSVVVDLGRMNRIVEVNAELAYAVLEPGVTQAQLYDYLRDQRLPLWLNPTGAGPSCSILGNTLERGFGIGPNGDHFQAQCGMEIVLADGSILRTGFGHYEGARAAHVYKYGVGPSLDGLFTQSNLGIVTKMGVWLRPAPEHFESCYLTCNREEQLGRVIDALRGLLFDGIFQGPVNLLHRNRVLIMLGRYPWDEMRGGTPLSESVASRLAAAKKIGAWNGVGALCGSRAQVQAAKRAIRAALRGKVDRLAFLSDSRVRLLERFPATIGVMTGMNVPELLNTLRSSYGMMKGTPSEVALSLAYWRNRRPMPASGGLNPARDNCGLMWFAPIIPMTAKDVADFRQIVEPIFARYRFECCITLTAVNERCFDCTLPLLFDRDNPDEVSRAGDCYAALSGACRAAGFLPYRLGLQSMDAEVARDDVFWKTVSRVKDALDPLGILAPGRYAR